MRVLVASATVLLGLSACASGVLTIDARTDTATRFFSPARDGVMANVQECPSASNTYFAEVMFDIAPDGAVENARLVRSNSDCFGQKALDAIRSTEYAGFEKDGQPVRYTNMTRSYQIKRFQRPLTLPARD